jgi:hypothetical protein
MSIKRVKKDVDYYSSPPPVSTPADIPGLLFWLDATDILNTGSNPPDGSAVAQWVDKSSNNYVFNRIDAAQSPVLQSTGFNGRPTVRVDSTMDGFQADPSFSSPTGSYTVFFVGQQIESNPGGFNAYLFDLSGTDRFVFWLNDDNSPAFYFQNAFQGPPAFQEGGLVFATWIFDENRTPTAELRINGITVRTDANFVDTDLSSNARLGSRFTAEATTDFDGRMSEFFFYNRTLTASEINQVEGYLRNKWGL